MDTPLPYNTQYMQPVPAVTMPKKSRRVRDSPQFRPIPLSAEMLSESWVKSMQDLMRLGLLQEWEIGRKGTHISSHFVTAGGTQDILTSVCANDTDYKKLVLTHVERAIQVIANEVGLDSHVLK